MPLYVFDVEDGEAVDRDLHGTHLPGAGQIWKIAVAMVDEAADARRHLRPRRAVAVVVRDEAGTVVYRSAHLGGPDR